MDADEQTGQYVVRMAGATHPGRVREHNEDAIGWDEELGLAVVADGVGGHQAGEVASRIVVDSLLSGLPPADESGDDAICAAALRESVEKANREVWQHAQESGFSGMSSTVVALRVCGQRVVIAYVGDSRVYRLRNGQMQQLSVDHSVVQEMIDNGSLSREEAATSSRRNLITRALGQAQEVQAEVTLTSLNPGDCYLLCSDGLSDRLTDEGMGMMLDRAREGSLESLAEELVETANAAGGQDNIAVVLVRVDAR